MSKEQQQLPQKPRPAFEHIDLVCKQIVLPDNNARTRKITGSPELLRYERLVLVVCSLTRWPVPYPFASSVVLGLKRMIPELLLEADATIALCTRGSGFVGEVF